MDRIVIGDVACSGTTWAFNAVKLLAQQVYGRYAVNAAPMHDYTYTDEAEIEILQVQDITADWQPATVVVCVRDIRDAFCSALAENRLEVAAYARTACLTQGVLDGIALLIAEPARDWSQVAAVNLRYENVIINKLGTLEALASVLFPDHVFAAGMLRNMAVALEIIPTLAAAFDQELPAEHTAPRSDIGIFRTRLPYSDTAQLEDVFTTWLRAFGYPPLESMDPVEALIYA